MSQAYPQQALPPQEPIPPTHQGRPINIHERRAPSINGALGLLIGLGMLFGGGALAWGGFQRYFNDDFADAYLRDNLDFFGMLTTSGVTTVLLPAFVSFLGFLLLRSLVVLSPGDARVVQFFGTYLGTIRKPGLRMTVPLCSKRGISLKVRNFETQELKVNDAAGNPVDIAAIVVWRVADTAKAVFAVENFSEFVAVQAEAALRHVATQYPYDSPGPHAPSLRGSADMISERIASEVASRISIAGLEVVEARISSLAYAQEIARAMLQRQQAQALIDARELIVDGSVSMARDALRRLEAESGLSFSPEQRAQLISNLLVVLSSETPTTPTVNIGK